MGKEKKEKGILSKLISKIVHNKILLRIIIIILIVVLIAGVWFIVGFNGKQKVDTEYLNALVAKSSELTTAKLKYTGMSEFTDNGVAFINRSDFIMVYKATARAGINVEDVKVTTDNSKQIVYIDIPKAEILDVKVDASSIKYFDEQFALFNVDEKEDSNKAIALAEEKAKEEAEEMGMLKLADEQSATLIKGILADAIPDGYKIEIK